MGRLAPATGCLVCTTAEAEAVVADEALNNAKVVLDRILGSVAFVFARIGEVVVTGGEVWMARFVYSEGRLDCRLATSYMSLRTDGIKNAAVETPR